MTTSKPAWTPFDSANPPARPDAGSVVVVLASEGAQADGWGGETALEMTRRWAAGAGRIVLADLGLEGPSLHALLGQENGEGISDTILYGASVGRVARKVPGEPFVFISAGTPVADASMVLAESRWGHLCQGFQQAGVTLVLYVPNEDPGAEQVLAQATDVVVLAEDEATGLRLARHLNARVTAVLGPAETAGERGDTPPAAEEASEEASNPPEAAEEPASVPELDFTLPPEDPAAPVELEGADLDDAPPVELPHAGVPLADEILAEAGDAPEEGSGDTEGGAVPAAGKTGGGRGSLIAVVLLVILGGLVAAWWFGFLPVPGFPPPGESTVELLPGSRWVRTELFSTLPSFLSS
ncbi:MAG: hypothetical protein ACE5GJ_11475 [Gemmatimonadota bacterium]